MYFSHVHSNTLANALDSAFLQIHRAERFIIISIVLAIKVGKEKKTHTREKETAKLLVFAFLASADRWYRMTGKPCFKSNNQFLVMYKKEKRGVTRRRAPL
jgi:hypothetical protein